MEVRLTIVRQEMVTAKIPFLLTVQIPFLLTTVEQKMLMADGQKIPTAL